MDIESIVINKLKRFQIDDFKNLRPHMKKQLLEIEKYMNKCCTSREESIKKFKKNNITIKGIADHTNVSKATIYNNTDTLKKYIEESIKEYQINEEKHFKISKFKENNHFNDSNIKNLKKENNHLKKLLDNISIELIEMNNLKLENENLNKTIDVHRYTIAKLNMENSTLSQTVLHLQKQINNSKCVKISNQI